MPNKALGTTLLALLLLGAVPGALAQAQATPSKPAGMKVQSGQPKVTKTADASGRKGPKHMNDDARHCLDLPTIAEIVKCAEPYRY